MCLLSWLPGLSCSGTTIIKLTHDTSIQNTFPTPVAQTSLWKRNARKRQKTICLLWDCLIETSKSTHMKSHQHYCLNKTWTTPMDMLHIFSSLLQRVEISPAIVENPVKGLMTLVQSLLGHFTPLSSTDFFKNAIAMSACKQKHQKNLAFSLWSLIDLSFSSFTADLHQLQMSCSRTFNKKWGYSCCFSKYIRI